MLLVFGETDERRSAAWEGVGGAGGAGGRCRGAGGRGDGDDGYCWGGGDSSG